MSSLSVKRNSKRIFLAYQLNFSKILNLPRPTDHRLTNGQIIFGSLKPHRCFSPPLLYYILILVSLPTPLTPPSLPTTLPPGFPSSATDIDADDYEFFPLNPNPTYLSKPKHHRCFSRPKTHKSPPPSQLRVYSLGPIDYCIFSFEKIVDYRHY